jgi:hypothetical protein
MTKTLFIVLIGETHPVPGGPNRSNPLGASLNPVNISGFCMGKIIISF